jgi:hypothetical protein
MNLHTCKQRCQQSALAPVTATSAVRRLAWQYSAADGARQARASAAVFHRSITLPSASQGFIQCHEVGRHGDLTLRKIALRRK